MSDGSTQAFRANWLVRDEAEYSHFTTGQPVNQIQLAFRKHWETWNAMFPELKNIGRVLEVGSGRGTLSMYFSQNGWDTTILDIVPEVLEHAKTQFATRGLPVETVVADCTEMPFPDSSFDVVFSVGLLEHFSDPQRALREQVRVLAPGGLLIGYVVPEPSVDCIQHSYEWVNGLLRALLEDSRNLDNREQKSTVYRSNFGSAHYSRIMSNLGCENLGSSGTYPLPMISWSTGFPFTLLPNKAEELLVTKFIEILRSRESTGTNLPWLCEEEFGQAFLVWANKGRRL